MSQDLYPTELQVTNLYCFKGSHTIELQPTVYAVLAEAEDNPARSNWLGKSTLLMAFAFAMFGWHTKRTDDEIITEGETSCGVTVKLNDGSRIVRTKDIGKSVQIKFYRSGSKVITQARAQAALEEHIGFSKDDFFSTFFYEQKQIGALVTSGAADRAAMVEKWLADELEPIQRLHVAVVRKGKEAEGKLAKLVGERDQIRDDYEAMMAEYHGEYEEGIDMVAVLNAAVQEAEEKVAKHKAEVEHARVEQDREKEMREKRAKAKRYERLVEEGKNVRELFDKYPIDAEQVSLKHQLAYERIRDKTDEAESRYREMSSGALRTVEFDGRCPVTCAQCPSAAWVRGHAVTAEEVDAAEAKMKELQDERDEAQSVADEAYETWRARQRVEQKLIELRAEASLLVDEVEDIEEIDEAETRRALVAAELAYETAVGDLRQVKEDLEWLGQVADRLRLLHSAIAEGNEQVELTNEAVAITGRHGAQQAIQELVMAKVELKANALLSEADIPLQVAVRWEQETKGLAKVCSECGCAFPTSRRVKECGACGATRGQNVQRKLTITPSNRSGAAEDLAGIALGIAASQWLKNTRGARWATVFIDEPFGALDAHNRHALGAHITAMLRSTYASAFVVAHDRAILSAMPGRINIIAGPDGSRIGDT